MSKTDELNALLHRQVELRGIMARSDEHAAKCAKLALIFSEAYPDDYAEYVAAREEYNEIEAKAAALAKEVEAEGIDGE